MSRGLIPMVVLFGVVTVPFMAAQENKTNVPTKDASAIEQLLIRKLRAMWDGEKAGDLNAVKVNLADDFTELAGDGGLYHKADVEKYWPDIKLNEYKLSDCTFKQLVKDAAYLTCRLEADATFKGQPLPKKFRVTSVWTKQGSDWLIRLYQGTVIPEPSNADTQK